MWQFINPRDDCDDPVLNPEGYVYNTYLYCHEDYFVKEHGSTSFDMKPSDISESLACWSSNTHLELS